MPTIRPLTPLSGSMVGSPFAAILSDRFGRRKAMFAGGFVIILGMIVAATGKTVGQLVAGRFILGLGIAIVTVAAPAYSIEIAPPHWRGRCTGKFLSRPDPDLHPKIEISRLIPCL